MKIVEITEGVGKIVKGVNTTRDVKPGETERQAKKYFGGNGKPRPLGVPGATPHQAFNMGLTEGYQLQLDRGSDMDVLHITDTKTGKRTEVRGKPNYEVNYDPADPLHQLLDKIGKASSVSDLMNGDLVGVNPRHPDGAKAMKATDRAFNEDVEVDLHGNAERGYVLSKIEVPKDQRGQGVGSRIMQQIIDRMDKEGAVIALTPDSVFGGSKSKLIDFYKRFGFVPNKGRNKDFRFRETMIRYPKQINEETGEEMLGMFQKMHHDAGNNDEMDAFIRSHDWKLADFTPDMFPSEEEFFDYDDPFNRVIDIDYDHRVDLSQPIIVGPQYSDGKYSVIDGNHRAARAQQLGKTIKGYFPIKQG